MKIIVWRPYTPARSIAHQTIEAESPRYLTADDTMQHDVFTWQAHEDIWGGLTDERARQALSAQFVTDFDPFRAPSERNFERLAEFLSQLHGAVRTPSSNWSDSAQVTGDEDDEFPPTVNALLAFLIHMTWIYEVFKDVPGASITVR